MKAEKLFTVYYNGQVISGLENVTANNANLMRLSPKQSLDSLNLNEKTSSNWKKEYYEIRRVK